ncbi:ribonuclease H-like domain-containing protein [Tanacetum coccineum]
MALPEDHLAKFHKMTDAKEMWEAIKSRFGGNNESKKMQKYILKQQFEGFSVSNSEGLHKGYGRFQSLLSQLKIHGAGVSTEDANQKFLRSLPSAWSHISLIMRTKPGVDSLNFDDLYNNLRVFENDVKGSTASSSSTQNVAFISENSSSTNDVSTAYGVSNPSGHNSQYEQTSSYSLLANQSSCPQLDHEDLEQLDEFDLEEMDLKWQVAMISMRMKKFYKKNGRKLQFDAKEPVGFDKTKVECYNCHKTGHFAKECRTKGNQDSMRRDAWNSGNKDKENGRRSSKQEDSKALLRLRHRAGGMHAVPPPMTRNYMPSGPDKEIADSQFTYGPKQSQPSESETQTSEFDTCESNISIETPELVSEPVVNESNVVCQPKVWSDAPIIKVYKSDTDDYCVSQTTKEQEQPSFARMAKQVELNNSMRKKSSQREIRPIWNNVKRVNHQNQFVPTAVLTRTGKILVNTARTNGTNNVNTAEVNAISAVRGKGKLLLSPQQVVIGDQKGITGTKSPNTMVDQGLSTRAFTENKGIVVVDVPGISFLPNTFWAEAVSTACYVLNRVLVTKPQNKTPYELVTGKILIVSNIRPFGCHVTILNTIDHLGKFDGKSDEGTDIQEKNKKKAKDKQIQARSGKGKKEKDQKSSK